MPIKGGEGNFHPTPMLSKFGYALLTVLLLLWHSATVDANVVINEIMYHPATDNEAHDFVELFNTGASAVNLQNWCIGGTGFCFEAGASIPSGGYLIIAKDAGAFLAHYGVAADFEYTGNLSNSGELLTVRNAGGTVVDAVEYADVGFWPTMADGEGPSLERIDPSLDANTPRNWRASIAPTGHTAGALNSVYAVGLPPWITEVQHTPDAGASTPIVVTCRVEDANTVTMTYKINFAADVAVDMHDDGLHEDGDAGDGIYGATIPGQAVHTLIRYRITADGPTGSMRYPRTDDTINYFGLFIPDPSLTSQIPIFHWYMAPADYAAAIAHKFTDDLEPAVLIYDGVVYDNIRVRVRGQTSRSWPKNHWKIILPQGHKFFAPELIARPVDQFSFQCNYSDKSYVREVLSYETFRDAGAPYNQVFHVRLHQNGAFYGLYNFLEAPDKDYLERNNLSTEGAWYKSDDDCRFRTLAVLPSEYQKENRKLEDYTDLFDLLNGINNLSGTARANFIRDHVDIPALVNYMAAQVIVHNNDQVAKNFFLYRDTEGTQRWSKHTWDMDLTFGRNFGAGGGVLSDGIWADQDAPHPTNPLVSPSHPLFSDEQHRKWDNLWNRMVDALHNDPQIREMFYRRLRTLMDDLLAGSHYEARIDELSARIGVEAVLDVAKWGQYGQSQSMATAISILKNDYLAVRRTHLFVTHRVAGSIPLAQSSHPPIVINELMYNPTLTQDAEFLELYNPSQTESVDLSGWRIDGIAMTIPAGAVILPQEYAIVVKNDVVFRSTYGSGKYIIGQYSGNLDNGGETITLRHKDGTVIDIVHYDDVAPWATTPDGGGPSLELIDASRDNNRAGNWAASLVSGGTPGAENSVVGSFPLVPDLYINEVLLSNNSTFVDESGEAEPWIEIYNSGHVTVDLQGMHLTDSYDNPFKWQFAESTPLCAGQFLVVWADNEPDEGALHAAFRLNSTSASVGLYTAGGALVDYLNTGALPVGISYGRLPDGGTNTYQLKNITPGDRNDGDASPIILNEYNAVIPTGFLKDGAGDTYWGRVVGNGGDWFELVVTRDHLDARGWQLVVANNAGVAAPVTLTLTDHSVWSNLRSGTIITVSEDLPDDVSFDPANGDWWINVWASSSASGLYITNANFDVTHTNWQLTIKDAEGTTVFGPAGEGVQPVSGIGNDEVFKLEEDPGGHIHAQSNYNDGASSTFGAPNIFSGGTDSQDFTALRANFRPCLSATECDDDNACTFDDCVSGECVNIKVEPCDRLSLDAVGQVGSPVFGCADSQIAFSVRMSGVHTEVNGAQLLLEYDPAQLSLFAAYPGDGEGSDWDSATPVYLSDDDGALQYAIVLLGSSTQADASVATFVFDVLPTGGGESPAYVKFATLCQEFRTKLTTVDNQTIIPELVSAPAIVTGPRAEVVVQIEGLSHAVSREVTFVLTACGEAPQVIETPVLFNSAGVGTATLRGFSGSAVWIAAYEGHTLRRRLPLEYSNGCFAVVEFVNEHRLLSGDFGTVGTPKDNLVDIVDFAILAARWDSSVSDCDSGLPAECHYGADVNGDGMQNTVDFTAIQINFLKTGDLDDDCPPAGASLPPVPGSRERHRIEAKAAVQLSDFADAKGARLGRASVGVGELSMLGYDAAAADLNCDGVIDVRDIRFFIDAKRFPVLPEFDSRLRALEAIENAKSSSHSPRR